MPEDNASDRTRELGVDFGSLAGRLRNHEYPTTSDKLVAAYGDATLGLQSGEQTLREVFEPLPTEAFESVEEARSAIFNAVDDEAIGRKGYSDRTPPAPGEEREESDQSF
jgi:hypothetical protein